MAHVAKDIEPARCAPRGHHHSVAIELARGQRIDGRVAAEGA